MPKETATDLSLIDTESLIAELANRHEEIIIISENRKKPDCVDIYAKTANGESHEIGFNIFFALNLLHTAEEQMLNDYLGFKKTEDED